MDGLIWKPNDTGAIQMSIYYSNSDMTQGNASLYSTAHDTSTLAFTSSCHQFVRHWLISHSIILFKKQNLIFYYYVFSVHRINSSPTLEYESWMHQVGGNGAIQCYVAHRGQRVLAFICINTFQSYISKRLESASMHICKSTAARHLHPCAQICLFDLWMWGEARLDL